MQRILLIDSSPTQRHALEKSIIVSGFSVTSLNDFSEAATRLLEMDGTEAELIQG